MSIVIILQQINVKQDKKYEHIWALAAFSERTQE